MEHEDNTQLDNNYLRGNYDEFSLQQNQQNLVENLQIASGFGAGGIGGVAEEIGVSIGGKFEEEEHDEEEWKYIKEVQQSEKQQTMKVGEGIGVGGDDEDVEEMQPMQEVDDEEEAAIIKNDGDFSTTSNTTSTTAAEEENSASVSASAEPQLEEEHQQQAMDEVDPMLQVEMEIETQLLPQENNSPTSIEESSLATISSSSENCENLQQQQQQQHEEQPQPHQQYFGEENETQEAEKIGDYMFSSSSLAQSNSSEHEHEYKYEEDKENADPEVEAVAVAAVIDPNNVVDDTTADNAGREQERPNELDFEMHSNLNPDAVEFVPTFSNPTSPDAPVKSDFLNFGAPEEEEQQQQQQQPAVADHASPYDEFGVGDNQNFGDVVGEPAIEVDSPHPTAVPRHLIGGAGDDVVAHSPRKGRGSNMEAISLPGEYEFEHEAAKRPHEIEQEVDLMGDGNSDGLQVENDENLFAAAGDGEHMQMPVSQDCPDYQNPSSPVSLIDHGPETSVDLDIDSKDLMKQSIYIENTDALQEIEQPIEELLNTVQPIPTDSESINNSFVEDMQLNSSEIPSKELLNVEEKEVISHSPSTEEIQMQFQNDFNASYKDIPAIPIDMDKAGHMQDSFYMEHTSSEMAASHETPAMAETEKESKLELEESLLMDTTNPLEANESIIDNSFAADVPPATAALEDLQFTDFTNEKVTNEFVSPSPHSTEEKHLMEETKENINHQAFDDLEQKMSDLNLATDSTLPKVEDVAHPATTITEDPFASYTQESEEFRNKASPTPEFSQQSLNEEPVFEQEQQPASPLFFQEQQQQMDEVLQSRETPVEEPEILPMESQVQEAESHFVAPQAEAVTPEPLVAEEDVNGMASPVQTDTFVPTFEASVSEPLDAVSPAEEIVEEPAAPSEPVFEPEHEPVIERVMEPEIEPVVEPEVEPMVQPEVEAVTAPEVEPVIERVTEPVVESKIESVVEPEIEAVTEPQIAAAIEPEIEPVTEPQIAAAIEPEIEAMIEPVRTSFTEEPVSSPIPVLEETASEPVVAPVAEEAFAEIASPVPTVDDAVVISEPEVPVAEVAAAAAVATAAAVGVVAVAATASADSKKPGATKKPAVGKVAPQTSKAKVDVKKPTEAKKPMTAAPKTSTAARPRTAPASGTAKLGAGASEKKTTSSSTTSSKAATTTSTAARKPLSTSAAARPATTKAASTTAGTKTTAAARSATAGSKPTAPAASARNGVAAKTTASRPTTTTTSAARKPLTSSTTTAAPKPRPSTSATPATKPSTLGIAAKPKAALSPRSTLTSQLRKTPGTTATAPKSPTKPASATNGIGKASTTTSSASRLKTTTTSTTTAAKTFSARPVPKSTSTTTTTTSTSRRTTLGGTSATTKTSTSSSSALRKSTPSKPAATGKLSPSKPAPITKNKTKDAPKTTAAKTTGSAVSAPPTAEMLKQLSADAESEPPKTNGTANGNAYAGDDQQGPIEHIGNGENGTHSHEENGLVEQAEMALMGGTA